MTDYGKFETVIIAVDFELFEMLPMHAVPMSAMRLVGRMDEIEVAFEFMKMVAASDETRQRIENMAYGDFRKLMEQWMQKAMESGSF